MKIISAEFANDLSNQFLTCGLQEPMKRIFSNIFLNSIKGEKSFTAKIIIYRFANAPYSVSLANAKLAQSYFSQLGYSISNIHFEGHNGNKNGDIYYCFTINW